MKEWKLNKSFIKQFPIMELTAQHLFYAHEVMDGFDEVFLAEARKTLTKEQSEDTDTRCADIEKLSDPCVIADQFRKTIDPLVSHALITHALQYEKEVAPYLLKRLQTSWQEEYIESAIRFFIRAQNDFTDDILACYDQIRCPYARSLACIEIGLRGNLDAAPKMFLELETLMDISDDENEQTGGDEQFYEQGAVIALHELYYRFCEK